MASVFNRVLSESYVFLKGLFRYKGTLFWVIIFPILFYILMVAIWGNANTSPVRIGVVDLDEGQDNASASIGSILVRALNESGVFKVKIYDSEATLRNALKNGAVDTGIVIPEGFTRNITSMHTARVKAYYMEGQYSGYYRGSIEGFLSSFSDRLRSRAINESLNYALSMVPPDEASFIVEWFRYIENPVNASFEGYAPEMLATKGGIRAFYAIGMIGVEVLFIGLSIGATMIIEARKEGTLSIILSSPMSNWEMLASETVASLLAVALSSISILAVSLPLGAKYNMPPSVAATAAVLIAVGAVFTIGLGLILSLLAKSEETAMAIVNGIAFPVMFTGGIVIPDFVLPSYLKAFANVYPLSRVLKAVRQMLIYNHTPLQAVSYAAPAIAATVIVYALGALVFNRLVSKAVEE